MVRSGPGEHRLHPRRRLAIAQPNLAPSDPRSLLPPAYANEHALRAAVAAKLPTGTDDLASSVALQNRFSELSSQQLFDFVAQRAITITNASGAVIAIAEGEAVLCRCRAGSMAPALGIPLDPNSGFSGECLRTGQVLCCDDSETDPRANVAACRQLDIRSILAVPIRREQRVIGILEAFSGRVGAFTRQHATALQDLAAIISDAFCASELPTAKSVHAPSSSASQDSAISFSRGVSSDATEPSVSPTQTRHIPSGPVAAVARLDTLENYAREPRNLLSRRGLIVATLAGGGLALGAILLGGTYEYHVALPIHNQPVAVTQGPMAAPPSPLSSSGEDNASAIVTAIRFHSRPEFSSIALELSSPVKYEIGRLHHPERIYFDLLNTHAAPGLVSGSPLVSGDRFVQRVRIGAKEGGITRVVLDLNCSCDYSWVISSSPPYRLIAEVHLPSSAMHAPPAATPRVTESNERIWRASEGEVTQASGSRHIKIVIDPGHGGTDRGTVGLNGLEEKDLVLEVAQHLGKLCSDRLGAEVTYTRTGDYFVPLEARSALANSVDADLLVSIHGNASNSRLVRGVETFYMDPNATAPMAGHDTSSGDQHARVAKIAASRQLAAAVQRALYTRLAAINPQLRNRGVKAAPLAVLVASNMPSIVSEISFISSASEERRLKDATYCEHIVQALYLGITTYLSHTRTPTRHTLDRASLDHIEDQSRSQVAEQQAIKK